MAPVSRIDVELGPRAYPILIGSGLARRISARRCASTDCRRRTLSSLRMRRSAGFTSRRVRGVAHARRLSENPAPRHSDHGGGEELGRAFRRLRQPARGLSRRRRGAARGAPRRRGRGRSRRLRGRGLPARRAVRANADDAARDGRLERRRQAGGEFRRREKHPRRLCAAAAGRLRSRAAGVAAGARDALRLRRDHQVRRGLLGGAVRATGERRAGASARPGRGDAGRHRRAMLPARRPPWWSRTSSTRRGSATC